MPPKGGMPHHVRFRLLMLDLTVVIAFATLDISMVSTALPILADHFHDTADIIWYVVAFRLSQGAFTIQFGKAYTILSTRTTFLFANTISIIGAALSAGATSPAMLIAGRTISGAAYAGLFSGSMMAVVHVTPLCKRPSILGIFGACIGLATVAGPVLGGAIVQSVGWRCCFYISLAVGVLTFLLSLMCFPESPASAGATGLGVKQLLDELDLGSSLLLISALTCMFIALAWGGTRFPWRSGPIIGLLVAFLGLAIAFLFHQHRRADKAAFPIRVIAQRSVLSSFSFATLLGSGTAVLDTFLPIYYQTVHGYKPAQSGCLMLSLMLTATLGTVLTGIATTRCGYYAPFMATSSVFVVVAAGIITTFRAHKNVASFVLATALYGLGYGLGAAGPITAVQTVLKKEDISLGIAMLQLGSAIGPAISNSIAQALFTISLSNELEGLLPGTNRTVLGETGIRELLGHLPHQQEQEAREAVVFSIRILWYGTLALGILSSIAVLPLEWVSVKRPDDTTNGIKSAEPKSLEQ